MTDTAAAPSRPRYDEDCCANCFDLLLADESHRPFLFCTELCRSIAIDVRYWRGVIQDEKRLADPEVQSALNVRIAHLLAGGYHAMARRIPAGVRTLVLERDKVCVLCGCVGNEIDHIDGDSSDLENLQLMCTFCHYQKTSSHFVPATPEQEAWIDALERDRVRSTTPSHLCDDPEWAIIEPQLRRERIARLGGCDPAYGKLGLHSAELRAGYRTTADRLISLSHYSEEEMTAWEVVEE
ncbi:MULTISPECIES: HNH endonuclease [unclassified Arthrobacter]|uniref:HNH endonuclease n=1 Tax=unclassified Arthrobacter TaxID=235627 RepID=UPI001F2C8C8E|nr:HNH endonuclease signature motif containing protein [Arthrobacter sp. FW305-BF8]UKA56134.1 HNH endonuclease [Arthrobacter sp. FW305-BF8]